MILFKKIPPTDEVCGIFCIFAKTQRAMDYRELGILPFYDLPELVPAKNRRQPRTSAQSGVDICSRRERLDRRNRIMTARYYYWTELKRRRFDDVVKILADREFFIDERTVSNVLVETQDYFNSLLREEADVRGLRRLYPGFDWD